MGRHPWTLAALLAVVSMTDLASAQPGTVIVELNMPPAALGLPAAAKQTGAAASALRVAHLGLASAAASAEQSSFRTAITATGLPLTVLHTYRYVSILAKRVPCAAAARVCPFGPRPQASKTFLQWLATPGDMHLLSDSMPVKLVRNEDTAYPICQITWCGATLHAYRSCICLKGATIPRRLVSQDCNRCICMQARTAGTAVALQNPWCSSYICCCLGSRAN